MTKQELIDYLQNEIKIRQHNANMYKAKECNALWTTEHAYERAYIEILNKVRELNEGS